MGGESDGKCALCFRAVSNFTKEEESKHECVEISTVLNNLIFLTPSLHRGDCHLSLMDEIRLFSRTVTSKHY